MNNKEDKKPATYGQTVRNVVPPVPVLNTIKKVVHEARQKKKYK